LLGIDWSPESVSFDQIVSAPEKGLYTWVIGRGHDCVDPLDRPAAYIGIGTRKKGGFYERLRTEWDLIEESAAHAHGRAMFRLDGEAVAGPVDQIDGADISSIEEVIDASRWSDKKERGIQGLRDWLSAPTPDVVHKAEKLCIRAAIHIGDTPTPLNSQHARAWGTYAPWDWGGWAAAQILIARGFIS